MRNVLAGLLALVIAGNAFARDWDIRFADDYDPREPLRLIVAPADISVKLKRVEPRTVSALLSTELLREYDVLDLARFEKYLLDRKLASLEQAFTQKGKPVVIDSAEVHAVANIEIYRWDEGTPGNIITQKKGSLGVRVTLNEPYSGSVLWSINLLDKTSGGANFLVEITRVFRELVDDLRKANGRLADKLDDRDERLAREEAREQVRLAKQRAREREEAERERLAEQKRREDLREKLLMADGGLFKQPSAEGNGALHVKDDLVIGSDINLAPETRPAEESLAIPGGDQAAERVERRRRRPSGMAKEDMAPSQEPGNGKG